MLKGFKFAGISAGIKQNDLKDMGLIYTEAPSTAAALFTRNQVVAAPVILGRKVIESGYLQAILVNSGNANCFTGDQGIKDAKQSAQITADELGIAPDLVMVSSTGVIGAPLPMENFKKGIPLAGAALSREGLNDFASAILTTDTFEKMISHTLRVDTPEGPVETEVIGVAKGSGMIRPDMATMLAYILTDAKINPVLLKKGLTHANQRSFNRITVDGDTSTNDTLACMASGAGKAVIEEGDNFVRFQAVLDQVCYDLARLIVKDGEGATKTVSIRVQGGASQEDAFKAAEAIAHSNLVKTAVYGEDPNWGRITAAAGRSGARVDQDKMDLFFGTTALVLQGKWQGNEAEKKAASLMKKNEIEMVLDLNLGEFSDHFLFCDFSENYVKINADYRS